MGGPAHLFAELKWGAKDALWNCVWDVAKCALVERLRLTEHAVLIVGFSDREWEHAKYGPLLEPQRWETAAFQRRYASEWRYWARPPKHAELHRTGPYRLPPAFSTNLIGRLGFRIGQEGWSLAVLAVRAEAEGWLKLDDHAQPLP